MQDNSAKRLLLAVLVSALLHAYLFGGVDLSLPDLKKEMHTIEARIQMPKPVAKPEAQPKPVVEDIKPTPPKPKPQQPKPAPAPEPQTEPAAEAPAQPPQEVAAITPQPQPDPEPSSNPADLDPEPSSLPIKDEGLVINENAYRYVETYFNVSTKIDGPAEGRAKIVYDLSDDGKYKLTFLTEAQGLAALFLPDLLQTSDGLVTKQGMQPHNYLYKFGDKPEKERKAIFDWQANTVQFITNKGARTIPLLEATQDQLSFMYQFMYVPPLQNMQLNIANGKKLREYDYQFEGEEMVAAKLGGVKAIHIVHVGSQTDEKIELWLAADYQYIPVKIRKTEQENKVYEFVANKIVTTRPPIDK